MNPATQLSTLTVATTADRHIARTDLVLWMLCAGVAACGAWFALAKIADHDVANAITMAGRILDGAVLYRDILEQSPPVYFLLLTLPVALARTFGADPILVLHAAVLGLALLATVLAVRLATTCFVGKPPPAPLIALPLLLALLMAAGNDFGQREHVLAILLAPYLMAAAGGEASRGTRLAVGVLAGIGVSIKPHFALYPVAVEAIVAWRARDLRTMLRTEVVAAVLTGAVAVAVTIVGFPDYLREIVPLVRATYYGYDQDFLAIVMTGPVLATVVLIGAALLLAGRARGARARPLVRVLAAAACAGLVVYLVQKKGWRYHALPAMTFAIMALGCALIDALAADLAVRSRRSLALAVTVIATAGLTAMSLRDRLDDTRRRAAEVRPLVELVSQAAPRPVLFLSTWVLYAFPVVNYGRTAWPYRYHVLHPLPGLYRAYDPHAGAAPFRRPGEMGPIEARFFATVVEDVERFPPQMIFVDRNEQQAPLDDLGFDFIAYFSQDPRFAHVMDGFRYAGRVSNHDVYVRREITAGR
jgi:hypothetical protein